MRTTERNDSTLSLLPTHLNIPVSALVEMLVKVAWHLFLRLWDFQVFVPATKATPLQHMQPGYWQDYQFVMRLAIAHEEH